MSEEAVDKLEWFKSRLDETLTSYTQPQDLRIGYGNLRHEYSQWRRSAEVSTNIAIIYETPGGSTAQINITYTHHTQQFSYIDHTRDQKVTTAEPRQVLHMIEQQISRIPTKRLDQLQQQIDTWVGEGKSRSQLFAELNKLLQTEFLGGRINATELKQSIQYSIAHYATHQSP